MPTSRVHATVFALLCLAPTTPALAAPPAVPSTSRPGAPSKAATKVAAKPEPLAIVGATVVDPGGQTVTDGVVVVVGDRIEAVGPRAKVAIPKGATVIDGTGRFVVPGLVDAHVHFFQSGGLYTRPDIFDLRKRVPYADEVARIRAGIDATLARTLRNGVTSVADVGGPFWNFDVRARAAGHGHAPRVAVTGPLISSVAREVLDLGDPPIVRCATADEARALVRREAERKPDYIKIWYVVTPEQPVASSSAMVRATIDEAHKLGLRVAVHATELDAAKEALRAGADILVHSVMDRDVDADFLTLARQRDVTYIPTLIVSANYGRVAAGAPLLDRHSFDFGDPFVTGTLFDLAEIAPDDLPPRLRTPAPAPPPVGAVAARNLLAVHKAGIRIAMGTDAGNIGTLHGASVVREMAAMEAAGLTATEVLRTATVGGGHVVAPVGKARDGKPSRPGLGRLVAGAPADLLIVDGDPTASTGNLARLRTVVRAGRAIDPTTLVPDDPAALAQRQLNAYNARDIDAFLSPYADDVEIVELDGKVSMKGLAAMRARYAPMFEKYPKLHCQLVKRMVIGNWVIDEELVSGRGDVIHAAAIYEIKAGKIARVRFLR